MSGAVYPSDMADKFMLRLPGDLRTRVKAQAARNRRSMNAEIVLMIEAALESTPSDLSLCSGQAEKEVPYQR